VADLIRNGSVNQGSVGFLPQAWTEGNGRKVVGAENYMGPRKDRIYTEVEFIEMTLTTVPDQARSIITSFKEIVQSLGLEESAASEEAMEVPAPAATTETPAPAIEPAETAPAVPAPDAEKTTKIVERDWLDALLGIEAPKAQPSAALSRAVKDRLVNVRDVLRSQLTEIEAVLQSAERADSDEVPRPAPQAQGGA
jgi:chaperonin cofactor prefoldin